MLLLFEAGGDSHGYDDIRRGKEINQQRIYHLDVGSSGGIADLEHGCRLMIGGEKDIVQQFTLILATLSPGVDATPPKSCRQFCTGTAKQGYLHCCGSCRRTEYSKGNYRHV